MSYFDSTVPREHHSRDLQDYTAYKNELPLIQSQSDLGVGGARVDGLRAVRQHRPDQVLGDELLHGLARQGAVHLQLLPDDRGGDELLLGHIVEATLVGDLVKEDLVLKLLLYLSLAPLLRARKGQGDEDQARARAVLLHARLWSEHLAPPAAAPAAAAATFCV